MAIRTAGRLAAASVAALVAGAAWSSGGAATAERMPGVGAASGFTVTGVRYQLAADARLLTRATITFVPAVPATVRLAVSGRAWRPCSSGPGGAVCDLRGVAVADVETLRVVAVS